MNTVTQLILFAGIRSLYQSICKDFKSLVPMLSIYGKTNSCF